MLSPLEKKLIKMLAAICNVIDKYQHYNLSKGIHEVLVIEEGIDKEAFDLFQEYRGERKW